jgi:hypothetical protein
MTKPFQKKVLQCTEEELFMTMMLRIGPPPSSVEVLNFTGHKWYHRGTEGFFAEHSYGRAFATLLSQHGEAKRRAPTYLVKYRYWCEVHRRLQT